MREKKFGKVFSEMPRGPTVRSLQLMLDTQYFGSLYLVIVCGTTS